MAYQIDFTASQYKGRQWKKRILRLLLVAAVCGAVWGAHYVYTVYNQSTLNMRLAEYESVSRPIEEMNAAWDAAATEYEGLLRYYRLIWAANATNFLAATASPGALRLRRGFTPRSWTLTTGGECRLDYRYVFDAGDKAEQARGLEDELVHAVTSVVQIAANSKVDVKGVQHENLLNVNGFDVSISFRIPDARSFPKKEAVLASCAKEIVEMRKKVQETKFADKSEVVGVDPTAQSIMMEYSKNANVKDKDTGKLRPDFPAFANVLDVSGWMGRADQFVAKYGIPVNDRKQRQMKEMWNKVGEARFPWDRFRVLDNAELTDGTKALTTVADGVKRFKAFLEKRLADNRRKLEPFIEAYDEEKIGNEPLVETDLKDRVAAAAGFFQVRVTVDRKVAVEPALLVKDDERFAFKWVPWSLTVGGAKGTDKGERSETEAAVQEPITLDRLADCARRAMSLGPGYAISKITVDFGGEGKVSGAVFEGLFPVKKVEPIEKK